VSTTKPYFATYESVRHMFHEVIKFPNVANVFSRFLA
jgi:hypothetical protein